MSKKKITIIVPVYGDWESLSECIESLKQHTDPLRHNIILANDCGPDADEIERGIKESIEGYDNFAYHRNKKNLGFLKNCNNAVNNIDKTNNDILLLNSDTKVTEGFLDEMQKVLSDDSKIGTVSPRSNNATICTVPLSAMSKKGINKDKSYKLFQKLKDKLPSYNIAPTSHGFCMLIRRNLINKYGLFDEVFGKGYGEEVDFCQRIRAHGYKCAISNKSYVFHLEARSFSIEKKMKLLEENNKIIRERYPNYKTEVSQYVKNALDGESAVYKMSNISILIKNITKNISAVKKRAYRKILAGDVSIVGKKVPKTLVVGLAGVIFMYVAASGVISVSSPWWLGKGDAPRHLDYVWSIYEGRLPVFEEGFTYPTFAELGKGVYSDQPAASHPPLYYMIHALFIGSHLESGSWQKAIALGRAINIGIGVMCIFALSWAGWLVGGKRKVLFSLSVPALGTMFYEFTRLNVNFAIDVLLVLLATLSFVFLYKVINSKRLTVKNIAPLAILSALGMATKASYIIMLAIVLLGVVISVDYSKLSRVRTQITSRILYSGLIISFVLIVIGWFYFRNHSLEGSFISMKPSGYPSSRPYKTYYDVLTGSGLWALLYSSYTSIVSISVSMFAVTIAGFLKYWDSLRVRVGDISFNSPRFKLILLMLLSVIGIFMTQIVHAEGRGGYYFRYFLPVTFPISIFISYGLLEFKKTKGVLVWLFSFSMCIASIYSASRMDSKIINIPSLGEFTSSLRSTVDMTVANGVPAFLPAILIMLAIVGSVMLLGALLGEYSKQNTID